MKLALLLTVYYLILNDMLIENVLKYYRNLDKDYFLWRYVDQYNYLLYEYIKMKYQGKIENIFSITDRGEVIATDIKWEPDIFKKIQAVSEIIIVDMEGTQSTFVEDGINLDKSFIGQQLIIET